MEVDSERTLQSTEAFFWLVRIWPPGDSPGQAAPLVKAAWGWMELWFGLFATRQIAVIV